MHVDKCENDVVYRAVFEGLWDVVSNSRDPSLAFEGKCL